MSNREYAVSDLSYHFAYIHQPNQPILTGNVANRLESIFHEIGSDKDVEIRDVDVHPDHVELVVHSPPTHSPALLVNWFKSISTRKYNHRHAETVAEEIMWAHGFFVGSVGHVAEETIDDYLDGYERNP